MSHGVRFVLVGGHAVAVHGYPRLTEDLDIFAEASQANAERLRAALDEFGFGSSAPPTAVLAEPEKVFMIGVKPLRIDILTGISGVTFAQAWKTRVLTQSSAGQLPVIALPALIKNKRASGRAKDLADVGELEARQLARRRRRKP
jgi:hypothetical protein